MVLLALIPGALLAATSHFPQETQAILAKLSLAITSRLHLDLDVLQLVLKVLLALGVIRTANRMLNSWAANQWRMMAQSDWHWPNEIAIVTGGCSGIGQKLVYGLLDRGARVVILDIQALPAEMKDRTGSAERLFYYKCDVTSVESVRAAAEAMRGDGVGTPSVLVNNAGVSYEVPILDVPISKVQTMLHVNTLAHWILAQQFVPHMVERNKGHVVTIASLASFVALPFGATYAASKAAALSFHEALNCELKHVYKAPGVVASIVHPNFVSTPLTAEFEAGLRKGGMPMLSSDQVARDTLRQLDSHRGGQVFVPRQLWIVSGLRGWPTWMQELLRDAIGISTSKVF